MTKTISFTCLHYGKSYLAYAIRSVIEHVDEVWIAYTPEGSHGHRAPVPCPETREELYAIAQAAGDKLRWYEGVWPHEGAHRESIHERCPDADIIVVLDSDEVWPSELVAGAIGLARLNPHIRTWRVPIIHYWRSFYRAVLHDPAYPVRVIHPQVPVYTDTPNASGFVDRTLNASAIPVDLYINHMGYAQPPAIVQYKQLTHGHRNEWRRDVDWFKDRYLANAIEDCHPVGSEWWNPEPVNPWDYMPDFMKAHPFAKLAVIE